MTVPTSVGRPRFRSITIGELEPKSHAKEHHMSHNCDKIRSHMSLLLIIGEQHMHEWPTATLNMHLWS